MDHDVAPLLSLEAQLTLGLLYGDLGRHAEGLALVERALAVCEARDDPRGAAWAQKNRGWILLAAGEAER